MRSKLNPLNWIKRKQSPNTPLHPKQYLGAGMWGWNYADSNIDPFVAMQNSTVYSCSRLISESIGQLPVLLYQTGESGKKKRIYRNNLQNRTFTKRMNTWQTVQEFTEWSVLSLAIFGNAYGLIKRNSNGSVYEIVPFRNPDSVEVNMDGSGNVYYTYATNDGKGVMTYDRTQIFHVKLSSYNGLKGLNPIRQSLNAVGAAVVTEKQNQKMFESGCQLSGVLSTEGAIPEEYFERLKAEWKQTYSGANNAGKTVILEYGMQYSPLSLSPNDVQLLEQRKFNKEDIAQIFRVPLSMLGDSTAKYASLEQNSLSFMRITLMPYITKLENELNSLLPEGYLLKYDESAFIRGDSMTQTEVVDKQITRGIISVNEGREILGYETVEGGDVFAVSTNNLIFGTWDKLESIQNLERANNQPPNNSNNQETTPNANQAN